MPDFTAPDGICHSVWVVEDRRDGRWRGYSSQYVRYELTGAAQPGRLVDAIGDELCDDGVRGRVLVTEGAR